jgi:ABC-2 type transport system ATP-binding protein
MPAVYHESAIISRAMPHVAVHGLTKTFRVYKKDPEASAWRNFWRPERTEVTAVQDVTFSVERGERVAFIGPNGAGKSTTIKMLVGILYPTAGEARVAGLHPQHDRRKLAYKIGTLFGQKTQLIQNLPVTDTFDLLASMYGLTDRMYLRRKKELIEAFQLEDFLETPSRKLSLGQRMRAEIACSLLHKPEIIFLDEPTIGLDVLAKEALRTTLLRLNKEEGVTLFLTSHDAGDVEALCERTLVINHGQLMIDQPTTQLHRSFFTKKYVTVQYASGKVREIVVNLKKERLNNVLQNLLENNDVADVDVRDPDLEQVIREIYAQRKV